jgi:hypothetical protein
VEPWVALLKTLLKSRPPKIPQASPEEPFLVIEEHRTTMAEIADLNSNMAIIIGPFNSSEFKRATKRAEALASEGDRTILDKLFEMRKEATEKIMNGGVEGILGGLIQAILIPATIGKDLEGKNLKVLACSLGMGIRDGEFHPSINIDLHSSTLANDVPLVEVIGFDDAEYLGAIIGESLQASWMRTSITHYRPPFGGYK